MSFQILKQIFTNPIEKIVTKVVRFNQNVNMCFRTAQLACVFDWAYDCIMLTDVLVPFKAQGPQKRSKNITNQRSFDSVF